MTPQDEATLASWIARADWPQIRPLLQQLLGVSMKPADDLVRRIRRELWRDFSNPESDQ